MLETQREVRKYLVDKKIFSDFKILGMKSGLSNCNYFIESEGKKYIVRTNKTKPSKSKNLLIGEYNVLRFLKEEGIDFVPETFYFDQENNIHILNYIQGRKIRFRNISPKGMKQVVEKLHLINSLAHRYINFCNTNNIEIKEPKSEVENIKNRIFDKIKNVKESNKFYFTKKWILERMEKDFKDICIDRSFVYLNHGDPADNLIVSNGNISIIDWEYAGLNYGQGLVDILAHGSLMPEKETRLLKYYSKISGEPLNELKQKAYTEKNIHYLLKLAKICFKYEDEIEGSEKELEEVKKNIHKIMNKYKKNRETLLSPA